MNHWKMGNMTVIVLVVLTSFLLNLTNFVSASSNDIQNYTYCEIYTHLKGGDKVGTTHIDENGQEITIWKDRICPNTRSDNLKMFFSLFLILAWGASVRTILRATKLNIPYTIILMLTGFIIGLGTRIEGNLPFLKEPTDKQTPLSVCSFWSGYTKIARIHPKLILYIFLPILIFESSFNMRAHVFMRSAWQILMVALPGFFITSFATAVISQLAFQGYHWTFAYACLFGSIISATDPVAVVAILRELGISDTLNIMIEGESLLNDGISIVLYEVFLDIVHVQSVGKVKVGMILWKFFRISFGGPLLGVIFAKIAVTSLSLIFNDATVEITITLVAAYATYYTGEALGLSGVVAVVVLGIRMNADSTSISPNAESLVRDFWKMLAYLANTVLFVVVGIVISETAINHIDGRDLLYLILLYVLVNVVRLFMLTLLMPLLSRIGYGLKWKEMIVMMWGGLRGAVGLCLALEVYRNKELCKIERDALGPKILFHTAGIVFLTLLINGTSTRLLLKLLKLDGDSEGKTEELSNAMKHIIGAQVRALAVQKQVRFFADVNWQIVDQYTRITNPFENTPIPNQTHVMRLISAKLEKEHKLQKRRFFHFAANLVQATETKFMEEARLRLLKALKIFFWKQFAQGVLGDSATQMLVKVAEVTEDKDSGLLTWADLSQQWRDTGFFNSLKNSLIMNFGVEDYTAFIEKPKSQFRQLLWSLATWAWFSNVTHCIALINTIPVLLEVVIQFKSLTGGDYLKRRTLSFLIVNILFGLVYVLELLVKVAAFGWKIYWREKLNFVDLLLIASNFMDIGLTFIFGQPQMGLILISLLIFRLGFRTTGIVQPWLPLISKLIDNHTKQSLFLGYDIGTGFISAIDDVLKFLPQIAQHPKTLEKLKTSLENERLETLRALGILQKDFPDIAIGVKTRHASRTVLNQMQNTLDELKEDGLLDDKDSAVLEKMLEESMKHVRRSPSSIVQTTEENILENVNWILGNRRLATYISRQAVIRRFSVSDEICVAGEPPHGIYVIISGLVKMHYVPSPEIVAAKTICGQIPNKDFFSDLTFEEEETDLFSTATVIGELGILTWQKVAATITCETAVTAYYIPEEIMREAMEIFDDRIDSLESRLWRSCGLRIAAALLPSDSVFQTWTRNKIRMHLERSAVPIRPAQQRINIPNFISTTVLLQGQIMDFQTRDIFVAPRILPRTSTKLSKCDGSILEPRLMLIAHEEIDYYEPQRPCSRHQSATSAHRQYFSPEVRFDTRQQRRLSMALNLRASKQ